MSFVYYDVNQWEVRFHEDDRALLEFHQTRDAKYRKPVQKLLDDFKDEHPYFFYLWLDWSGRLKLAPSLQEFAFQPMKISFEFAGKSSLGKCFIRKE